LLKEEPEQELHPIVKIFKKKYKRIGNALKDLKSQTEIRKSQISEYGVPKVDNLFSVDCFATGIYSILILLFAGAYSGCSESIICFHYNTIITITICLWILKALLRWGSKHHENVSYRHILVLIIIAIFSYSFIWSKSNIGDNWIDYSSVLPIEPLEIAVTLLFTVHHFARELILKSWRYQNFYWNQNSIAGRIKSSITSLEKEVAHIKKGNYQQAEED